MQKRNIPSNRIGILLAAAATTFAMTPGLTQSGNPGKFDLSEGGGAAGPSLDPLATVARSAWDQSEASDRGIDEPRDLAQISFAM